MSLVQVRPAVSGTYSGSLVDSFAALPAIGNVVIVTGSAHNAGITFGVTDNQGHTYTVVQTPSADSQTFIAYAVVTASSGTFTVSVATGGTQSEFIDIAEFSLLSSTPADSNAYVGVLGAVSASAAVSNELAVTVFASNGVSTVTIPSGYSAFGAATNGVATFSAAYKQLTALGTETATWTGTTSGSTIEMIMLFFPGSVGGGTSFPSASSKRFNSQRHSFGLRS